MHAGDWVSASTGKPLPLLHMPMDKCGLLLPGESRRMVVESAEELTALEADEAAAAAAVPASPDAAKAAWVALTTAREADEMLAARVLSLSNGLAGARDDLLLRMAVRVAASESAALRRAALLEGPLAAPVALLCAKQSKSGAEAAQAIASWGRAATASLSGFSQALRCTVRAAVFRPERVR